MEAIQPDGWKRPKGYAHAMRTPGRLSVAGLIGTDPTTGEMTAPNDFAGQWAQIWANLGQVLDAASAAYADVAVLRIYLTDLEAYSEAAPNLGRSWREAFADHLPAITMVEVSGLIEGALIEVEAEAVLDDRK